MFIERFYDSLLNEKINRDKVNSNYLSNEDYDVCNYLIDYIPVINYPHYGGKPISKKTAIKESLELFRKFDSENYQRLIEIIRGVKIIKDYSFHRASVITSYAVLLKTNNPEIITPGEVSMFHIPKKIHNIDIVNFGHEYCHMLKETNILEQKYVLSVGEVIPMFYELIDYENDYLRSMHLQYRLHWFWKDKDAYIRISEDLEKILYTKDTSCPIYDYDKFKEINEYARSAYGGYLCSFYYALILYNMYKEDHLYILSYVRDVLSHKMTTYEMLNKLNIYCNINEVVFEKEFNKMKRVLSR